MAHRSAIRACWRFVLSLAVLATLLRLGQLALAPTDGEPSSPAFQVEGSTRQPGAREEFAQVGNPRTAVTSEQAALEAELAELYAQCPTAGVLGLDEALALPEKVDALLPSYQQTAARESHGNSPRSGALPPAVPRIRYPHRLQPNASHAGRRQVREEPNAIRVAQAPRIAASAAPPVAVDGQGDWLVDPNDWYTPEERARRESVSAEEESSVANEPAVESEPADEPSVISEPSADDEATAGAPITEAPTTEHPTTEAPAAESVGAPPAETRAEQPLASENQWTTPEEEAAPETQEPKTQSVAPIFEAPAGPALGVEPSTSEAAASPVLEPGDTSSEPTLPPVTAAPSQQELFAPPPADAPAASVPPIAPPALPPGGNAAAPAGCSVDPHLELFAKNAYPSARECATCHEEIYEQWSISAHAYAAVSPMFHKFEQKLNDLSKGTVGYFCMRCHAPVATSLYASRAEPIWNLPEVARDGVTCIACHRVQYVYGKSNGERRIEEGNVFAPVMGGIGGDGVAETIHRRDEFKVKTSSEEPGPGQNIHVAGIYFDPLTRSESCTPCHQVAVHPGIKLEVVWEQYRASPACKKGIQCQDCHMGRVPGLPLGYDIGAVAKVADKTVNDQRKKSNHVFYGPNYSIAHPGVFPFHLKANRWTIDQWLLFDWRAGWGTDEFEDRVADGAIACNFPPCWTEADDRYDAREIVDENLKKLARKRDIRREVMENGSHVEGPFFDSALACGQDVKFHYIVTNTNEGHNLLTASLGAQPQLWANVVLIGPDGRRLWETGYTDSSGDLANSHSMDVRHGRVPYDWQLFNLQTMFLITGAKGTDREFFMPVNVDIDQLPFLRPGVQPISTINHPPFIRMESQSLAPLGARKVPYRIPGKLIRQPGTYRLSFRMRSRAEPIYLMRFCDATPEMERMMNEWMIDVHPMSVEFYLR